VLDFIQLNGGNRSDTCPGYFTTTGAPKCILLTDIFYLLNLLALSKIQLCKLHNNESNEMTMKRETTKKWQELDLAFTKVPSQDRSHKSLIHDTK